MTQNTPRQNSQNSRWKRTYGKKGRLVRAREAILGDWYGPERATEAVATHLEDPESVGNCVNEIFHDIGMHEAAWLDRIKKDWQDLVGEDVASHSHPVALRRKTLEIEVYDTAWYYELTRSYGQHIEERVRSFSNEEVQKIRFTPQGRNYGAARTKKKYRRFKKGS